MDSKSQLPRFLAISGAALLALGLAFSIFLINPVYRPIPVQELQSQESVDPLKETPFYYITAPLPNPTAWMFPNLPYQKGLPKRFLPRILFASSTTGEDLLGTLILNGPETLQTELKWNEIAECFSGWLKCRTMKKEFLSKVDRVLTERSIRRETLSWFHVKNSKIFPDEEPKGLHVTGFSKTAEGTRAIEAYFLINSRNAIQSIIFENEIGPTKTHPWLATWIQKMRMTSDLPLQKLQAKNAVLKTRITPQSLNEVFQHALIKLSSLLTVEPGNVDGWYHLAGISKELNRRARSQKLNMTEKRSRLLVLQVERYLTDIAPDHPRLREVSTMKAEIEK